MLATNIGNKIIKHDHRYCIDTYVINQHNLSVGDKIKFTDKNNVFVGELDKNNCINNIIMLKEEKAKLKTILKEEEQKEVTDFLSKEGEPKEKVLDEFRVGAQVEREHEATYKWIKEQYEKNKEWPDEQLVYNRIARDHISEHKDYYQRLNKSGLIDEKILIKN